MNRSSHSTTSVDVESRFPVCRPGVYYSRVSCGKTILQLLPFFQQNEFQNQRFLGSCYNWLKSDIRKNRLCMKGRYKFSDKYGFPQEVQKISLSLFLCIWEKVKLLILLYVLWRFYKNNSHIFRTSFVYLLEGFLYLYFQSVDVSFTYVRFVDYRTDVKG